MFCQNWKITTCQIGCNYILWESKVKIYTWKPEKKKIGQYTRATLNPNNSKFQEILSTSGGLLIFDVGCGGPIPRLSWTLGKKDVWIGCDPNINSSTVHIQPDQVSEDAKLIVFNKKADEVPIFIPDIISFIAPNQRDIVDEALLYEIEKFLSNANKTQILFIVLDSRTNEAGDYQRSAIDHINRWAEIWKFKTSENYKILEIYNSNSADLGENNILKIFVRNLRI